MTYTIDKNAKNVWIRDNANTMDLSVQTNADTVYLNNGRTVEQELGEGSMVSNVVTVDSAMNNVIDETLDGAYESCLLKGVTKYIDNDTNEILDTFVDGRNLSLIDVKMPILRNVGKNLFDGEWINETVASSNGVMSSSSVNVRTSFMRVDPSKSYYFSNIHNLTNSFIAFYTEDPNYISRTSGNARELYVLRGEIPNNAYYMLLTVYNVEGKTTTQEDKKTLLQVEEGESPTQYEDYKTNILTTSDEVVLRKVGDIKDTYNALTGEYVQCIGEREYQIDDENNTTVVTDMTKTQYVLAESIKTVVDPIGIPFAYANGHVILESGYSSQSLLPTLKYSTVINRTGQIVGMGKTLLKQEKQLTDLEKLLIKGVIGLDYNNTLMTLNLEIDEVI